MMKLLLLVVLVVVVYLVWRNARITHRRDAPPPESGGPQEMVSCPVCGLHLPKPDAVAGADGLFYCSNEHRLRAGG